jgi:transglutaminase-like putative cysteine protease
VAGASQLGFSKSGKLSSVLTIMEDTNPQVVLRIESERSPGYLRAMGFEAFRQSEWSNLSYMDLMVGERDSLLGRSYSYRLSEREPSRQMTVRHESVVIDAMFTPLGTCSVEAPYDRLYRDDDDGTLHPFRPRANLTYDIAYSNSYTGKPPNRSQMQRMLVVPGHLDARIRQLATRVFRGCTTTSEKIAAVTRYFQTNYTYALGLNVPAGQDELTYFLVHASTGYCEYFASGAAILLRLADVPTRYVTGFLVTEKDEGGDVWIARNSDAHAWVEAWDRENEVWALVEATAQEDLRDDSLADRLAGNDGGSRMLLHRLIQAVYDYGLFGVLGWFFEVYSLQTAVSVSLAFLGSAVGLALLRRHKILAVLAGSQPAESPELMALHKMLGAMDRRIRPVADRRGPQETLHAFAQRIRRARPHPGDEVKAMGDEPGFAEWYLDYAHLRYGGAVRPERVAELRRLAERLRASS